MPLLTQALVRAALGWLAVSLLLLALAAAGPLIPAARPFGVLGPAATHGLVLGFVGQMIFGVALWMFPRPLRTPGRADAVAGWCLFGALNAGLALRLVAEPLVAFVGTGSWGRALAASAALQWSAACAFVALIWPRVRAR